MKVYLGFYAFSVCVSPGAIHSVNPEATAVWFSAAAGSVHGGVEAYGDLVPGAQVIPEEVCSAEIVTRPP